MSRMLAGFWRLTQNLEGMPAFTMGRKTEIKNVPSSSSYLPLPNGHALFMSGDMQLWWEAAQNPGCWRALALELTKIRQASWVLAWASRTQASPGRVLLWAWLLGMLPCPPCTRQLTLLSSCGSQTWLPAGTLWRVLEIPAGKIQEAS